MSWVKYQLNAYSLPGLCQSQSRILSELHMLCTASSHFVLDLCRRPFYGCARRLLFVHKETPGTRLLGIQLSQKSSFRLEYYGRIQKILPGGGGGGGGPDNYDLCHQHSLTADYFGFNLHSFLTLKASKKDASENVVC